MRIARGSGLRASATPRSRRNVRDLAPTTSARRWAGPQLRFWHLDGDHSREQLTADLDLAAATLHPQGIICLDDMLHPGYPLLVVAVYEWLERHPDWRVLCVIDREDIVAAAKFVLCHKDVVPLFEQDLMDTFKAQHFVLGSEWERYFCVVLTPQAAAGDGGLERGLITPVRRQKSNFRIILSWYNSPIRKFWRTQSEYSPTIYLMTFSLQGHIAQLGGPLARFSKNRSRLLISANFINR